MDWWLLQLFFSQQQGQPSNQKCIGNVIYLPEFGLWRIIDCEPSRKSSVVVLIRQWKGHFSNRSKSAQAKTCTCTITSPAPKSSMRFSSTPIIISILVLADDILIVWFEWIGKSSSFHIHLGIAMISDLELRTPWIVCPVSPILALIA